MLRFFQGESQGEPAIGEPTLFMSWLWRGASIRRDRRTIRDTPQIVTGDDLHIAPDVTTVFEGCNRINPPLLTLL